MAPSIRALQIEDVPAAAAASAAAFGLDISDDAAARRWEDRLEHLLQTDPRGSFVAELGGEVIGVAQAMQRERIWCLSLLAVRPDVQSAGAGHLLTQRALAYGSAAEAALIVSSNDPRALRLYGLAGFSLRPAFEAVGALDRSSLPPMAEGVREDGGADLSELADISREVRGAPHTPELEYALSRGGRLLRLGNRGFAVVQADHGVWLLVARDEAAATDLLWSALALGEVDERASVRWITTGQDWAINVVLRAGLRLTASGALCVRGDPGPLRPFVPSAPFA